MLHLGFLSLDLAGQLVRMSGGFDLGLVGEAPRLIARLGTGGFQFLLQRFQMTRLRCRRDRRGVLQIRQLSH